MSQTARSTAAGRGAASGTGRSVTVFLITLAAAMIASTPKLGGAGLLLAGVIAFGVTEGVARRFPEGVRLTWLFRPTVLSFGAAATLFLASAILLENVAAICIEGGRVVGFPYSFFVQCYSPGGIPEPAEFLFAGLVLDLVFWYVMGTLLASFVRPREPALAFIV